MNYRLTLRKNCEINGLDYKMFSDDRANGADFFEKEANGRIICDTDDCAATAAYAHAHHKMGLTVRVAGKLAKHLRRAMRDYPTADQLTIVTLQNGLTFVQPTADLDLSTGFNSGSYVICATMFDVRNLRQQVRDAVEAEPVVIGGDDD
ncbi:MAG: hypothetical protein ACK4TC_06465 [Sphingomonas pseudosanguinis]|uniref:hypothetical protein n=1 Tax=Sphingomonas pseudosanguinis TaxID=413712 RepID=UPI0039191C45